LFATLPFNLGLLLVVTTSGEALGAVQGFLVLVGLSDSELLLAVSALHASQMVDLGFVRDGFSRVDSLGADGARVATTTEDGGAGSSSVGLGDPLDVSLLAVETVTLEAGLAVDLVFELISTRGGELLSALDAFEAVVVVVVTFERGSFSRIRGLLADEAGDTTTTEASSHCC